MMRKTSVSEFIFYYRSVFVLAVGRILEGERDCGEQALSTPTLQRSHILRGVVNVFFVCVKAQGVKVVSLRKIEQLLIRARETHLRTSQAFQMLYFIVWFWPGSYSLKVSVWPPLNNEMQLFSCCLPCEHVSVVNI